jgi:hypothetical protein
MCVNKVTVWVKSGDWQSEEVEVKCGDLYIGYFGMLLKAQCEDCVNKSKEE